MQHMAVLVVIGLAVVGVFVITAGMMGASRTAAARASIRAWLAAAIANALYGVFGAALPRVNELAAFVPVFGVPALVAYLLSRFLSP